MAEAVVCVGKRQPATPVDNANSSACRTAPEKVVAMMAAVEPAGVARRGRVAVLTDSAPATVHRHAPAKTAAMMAAEAHVAPVPRAPVALRMACVWMVANPIAWTSNAVRTAAVDNAGFVPTDLHAMQEVSAAPPRRVVAM